MSVARLYSASKVWIWVAVPFPVSDPYNDGPFPEMPKWPHRPSQEGSRESQPETNQPELPFDVNFYFFLFWYYGYVTDHWSSWPRSRS